MRICLVILIFLLMMFSCKTVKNIAVIPTENSLEKIYDSLKLTDFGFETLEIKFSVDYSGSDQSLDLKGNLKMLKDSLIWVSLSPGLGLEGVRFMCTPDSLFVLDRVNKSLTKGTYQYLKEKNKIDMDFRSIQSILLNNFFIYPSVVNERDEFLSTFLLKNDSNNLGVYRKSENSVENLININPSSYKIVAYYLSDLAEARSLQIKYSKSRMDNYELPEQISVSSNSKGKVLNVLIKYVKITKNEPVSFSFKVPSNYKTIMY